MSETSPIDLFIAYAQADADLLKRLRIQLRAVERIGLVDAWHDGEIEAGSNREEAILKAMKEAEIILLLVSADFIASEFSYEKEVKEAMKLHELGQAVVIPVILKECSWQYTPFAKLQVLPQNAIPITNEHWKTTDRAFQQVITEVVRISNAMRSDKDISTIRSEVKETSTTTVTQEKTITYSETIQKNKPTPTPPKSDHSVIKYATLFFGAVILVAFLFKQFGAPSEVENPITDNIPVKEKTEERTNPVALDPPTKKESSNRVSLPSFTINGLNWMTTNWTTNSPDGSWCPDNKESNCEQYGRLYLFKNALNICPQGWYTYPQKSNH